MHVYPDLPPPADPHAHLWHPAVVYGAVPPHLSDAALMPPPPPHHLPSSSLPVPPATHIPYARPVLAPQSPNLNRAPAAAPSSSSKPASTRKKASNKGAGAAAKASSVDPGSAAESDVKPDGAYLAPDYTLNPAGPASSADIDFKCPHCDKIYRGKHARSIWRRHLQDKHGIPLSQQPRRTRWDNDASRPRSEEEKRTRTLESKRRWARKNRLEKTGGKGGSSVASNDGLAEPSVAGSVGTPASESGGAVPGAGAGDDEGDSSFENGSVSGWSGDGGAAGRGGSAPVPYGVPPSNPFYGAGGASVYGRTPTKQQGAGAFGSLHHDPYLGLRHQQRSASSLPPAYPHDLAGDEHHPAAAAGAYHYGVAGASTNPYSHPFLPAHQQVAQEQAHLGYGVVHPSHVQYDEYGQPLNPSLLSASTLPPRRPSSNPSFASSSNPYDLPPSPAHLHAHAAHHPHALHHPTPIATAGQPAPVALPYYARRQSPARVITSQQPPASGIAAGVPAPSSASRAGALESPVKLRRTGANGKGKEPGGPGAAAAGPGGGVRDDAAGILLALKAGPSSPMPASPVSAHAHIQVQSPVSSVRGEAPGAGRSRPVRKAALAARAAGRRGEEDSEDEAEEGSGRRRDDDGGDDDESEDDAAVQALMLRSRAASTGGSGALSPWRSALQNHASTSSAAAMAQRAVPAAAVSPRKRGRSESPAPNLASTSSGEGSTAAAHALLATAKKAHQYASISGGGADADGLSHPLRGHGTWSHEMSLVATPTPGNLMRIAMESSPVVRFGGGGAGNGPDGIGDSEGDMIGAGGDDDDGDVEDAFTSSSGGARRQRRGRSVSPSSQKGRRRPGGSSSSGAGAATSSSSQPRPLHHHHPVGLTSELGDFDLQGRSSSSARQQSHHHHHDPLREHETSMAPHPGSSSSVASQLVTPAPAGSRTTTSAGALAAAASLAAKPSLATHPHDPFLATGTAAALPLSGSGVGAASASTSGLGALPRTSSPPGGFSSFLFSSPAHPQFSKTLGLTAAPGPGVLYTGVGETPARGALSAAAGKAAGAAGGRTREPSAEELLALGNAQRDRFDAMKTPVMARVALEGARRAAGGLPPSDLESNAEEDDELGTMLSSTTGTDERGESQSPGKALFDGDEEDEGEEDAHSLDD
ncbi:uncharacterized protein JCM10292_002181 [Rhodotorula paludigena]|uniref:uncharacterized protein n=1 Tax=Rhodotorula paludigena TaxID=86838 RepID=UPI00317DD08E